MSFYLPTLVLLFSFRIVCSQSEIRITERCDFTYTESEKLELITEPFKCSSPPEGCFLLRTNDELAKFHSSYPANHSACNTYQLPIVNFDTCMVLFFKIAHWSGVQPKKQFYYREGSLVIFVALSFKAKDVNSAINSDWGYYLVSKRYLTTLPVVYTCHKEID